METLHISDVSELKGVAQKVVALLLQKRISGKASVLALNGDLGAGKTAFTKVLAQTFGINEDVISPTFVIMKRYEIEQMDSLFNELVHIDAYRIDDIDEMRPIHFEEILQEEETLISIEWAERIISLLPPYTVCMNIQSGETESSRIITLT
jgi:tRNA threonylcarbamoyladenosine biosynthesis protein TsaE